MDCKLGEELSHQIEKKLNRIQGQVNGISKMVLNDRSCEDILVQISAVKRALDGVAKDVMYDHIGHCVNKGMQMGNSDETMEQIMNTVNQLLKVR